MAERRHSLSGQLVSLRRELGLSQAEVAARMGTSQSAVARFEAGDLDVRLSTVERYTTALGGRLEWRIDRGTTPDWTADAGPAAVRAAGRPAARARSTTCRSTRVSAELMTLDAEGDEP